MRDSRPSSQLGLYRAGITGPEHRRSITVGRESLFQDVIDILRKTINKKPKHHFLFIGPRGIGKTHLLSLIEDEIGRDEALTSAYHVVRFAEESHRVLSFCDFLLGVCEILSDTLPDEPQWRQLQQQLASEERDEIIVDTLVQAIRKRRRQTQQALIIMLENLHQVFEQQIKDTRSIAALRGFFMEDNGCLLVATAPLHFGGITDHKQPFYDFFDVQILDQLSETQTIALIHKNLEWEQRNDLLADFSQLRPKLLALYRMTGGSPRLTLMLYELIAHETVSEVKRQFELLLDRITPFYQDRMRDLGPQERAVLETLAIMRDQPKTPTAIAAKMRMKQAQVSTLLKRLSTSQYIRSIENVDDKRSRFYTIREGFFDIWLAMNVSRGARQRLPFLVEFFAQFYPSIEERNRKREEYRQRLHNGEFDAPHIAISSADLHDGLDYLSEVGTAEERASEKLRLANMHVKEGNPEYAKAYLREVRCITLDNMGTWIVNRAEFEPQLDYLTEIDELITCWDSLRAGELESFVDKVKMLGEGLTFNSWSETKIEFLREHLTLLPHAKDRVETRLRLGSILMTLARWGEAETELKAALEEATPLGDDGLLSWTLNDFAQLFKATNRLAEAEALMRRVLAITETSFGVEHPNVAKYLNNLVLLLQDTNRLSEAEPLMRRALAIGEANFGSEHQNVATYLNNLGMLFKASNRLAEAEPLMRRALAIDEASFGIDHPNVAIHLSNLAMLLKDTNRLAEAEPLMRQALVIDEASFGMEHPNVAIRLNNLALLLHATEAEPLMRQALAILENSLVPGHPNILTVNANLVSLLEDLGMPDQAEIITKRLNLSKVK
jgi:tetratricopeptide (TPR) repeat protein/DNA-binding MarR family transcriptional regulator